MKKKWSLLLIGLTVLSLSACGSSAPESESVFETTNVSESSKENIQSEESNQSEEVSSAEESSQASSEEPEEELSLRELFAEHGMKIGTCLTPQMTDNFTVQNILTSQFNSITMENAMKPDYIFDKKESIASGDLVVKFGNDVIKMLDWARKNDMAVRGHTLVWYSQTPAWIFYEDFDTGKGLVSRDVMLARMESYIRQVFESLENNGYSDLFYAYDVVNEAWMEDGSMRENNWSKTIGDDYLWYAFYYADKYAPDSIDLYYNDYNEQFKGDTLVKFVKTLVDENGEYLIDGIGLQAHLYTQDDLDLYFQTIDKLSETGLKLQLTELDVCLGSYQHPQIATDDNLKVQGQFYYNLVNGLLERVDAGTLKMDALTLWGVSDAASWRREYSPLLYGITNKAKYAYYGVMQVKEKAGF